MVFSMPLYAENSTIATGLPGPGPVRFDHGAHGQMAAKLENDRGSFIRFFVEPVVVALNHAAGNYRYRDVCMTGISGGGWTTHLCAAIDPRIRLSVPVAGSLPMYLRTGPCANGSLGDDEQTWPALYKDTASWLDLYILGGYGPGRAQVHVLNKYDSCCFGGVAYRTFEPTVTEAVRRLGAGSYRVHLDQTHREHKISDAVITEVLDPLLTAEPAR
jgi:hypothetical protein